MFFKMLTCLFLFSSMFLKAEVSDIEKLKSCVSPTLKARYETMLRDNKDLYEKILLTLLGIHEFCEELVPIAGGDSTETGRALMKFSQMPQLFNVFKGAVFDRDPQLLLHIVGSGDYVKNSLIDFVGIIHGLLNTSSYKKYNERIQNCVDKLLKIIKILSLDLVILRDIYEQPFSQQCDLVGKLPTMGFKTRG